MLRDEARPARLVEGPDFTYGKGAAGTVETLRAAAVDSGVDFRVVEPVQVTLPGLQVVGVSSSLVRWLVVKGRARDAAACLGRPYTLRGVVVHGYERGRTIGFPTANVDVGEQLIPADGVYAATVVVGGVEHAAALSIGTAPTFANARRQVEAYLLDFNGDLYDQVVDVRVESWVRDQTRFPGVESLVARGCTTTSVLSRLASVSCGRSERNKRTPVAVAPLAVKPLQSPMQTDAMQQMIDALSACERRAADDPRPPRRRRAGHHGRDGAWAEAQGHRRRVPGPDGSCRGSMPSCTTTAASRTTT